MKRLLTSPAFTMSYKKGATSYFNRDKIILPQEGKDREPHKKLFNPQSYASNQKNLNQDRKDFASTKGGMFNNSKDQTNQQKRPYKQSLDTPAGLSLVFNLQRTDKSWKQGKKNLPTRDDTFLRQIFSLVKQEKYQQINNLVTQIYNSSQKLSFLKNIGLDQICQNLLFDEVKGKFNSQSSLKFNIAQKLCQLFAQKKNQNLEFYTEWVTPILRNLVRQYQNSIPKAINCFDAFEKLLLKLIKNYSHQFKQSFFTNEDFFDFFKISFYGKQQKLQLFIDSISKYNANMGHRQFVEAFRKSLMLFKIRTGQSAFKVTETLLKKYKQSFYEENIRMATVCLILAAYSRYMDMFQHFQKYHSQVFTKFSRNLFDKIYEFTMIDNMKTSHQLDAAVQVKLRGNFMMKIRVLIKKNKLNEAYKIFQTEYLKKQAIKRWESNIFYILKRYQTDYLFENEPLSQAINRDATSFVLALSNQTLWKMFLRSQDFKLVYKNQLKSNTDSYWKAIQQKKRSDQIYKWEASGFLNEVKQVRKVPEGMFNLQTYLRDVYPQQKQKIDERYQVQKDLIKYSIKVQALVQAQKTETNYAINDDLKQIQSNLSEKALQVIDKCGLKDYDVYTGDWKTFAIRFRDFQRYNYITKDKNLLLTPRLYMMDIEDLNQDNSQKQLSLALLDDIWVKARELFFQAQQYVRIEPNKNVQQFILWGLYSKEPMSIYMGQKLAMLTGQKIPHYLAKQVSDMLSYRRDIDPQLIRKCKQALQYIGKINRQKIYDDNKDYHHILRDVQKQRLAQHIHQYQANEPRLLEIDSLPVNVKDLQQEPLFYFKRASQRFDSV